MAKCILSRGYIKENIKILLAKGREAILIYSKVTYLG